MLWQRQEHILEYMEVYPEIIKNFRCYKLRPVTWLWKRWNNLRCCVMIIQVISLMLMMAENIWLHRKLGTLKTYHQSRNPKQHIKQARYQSICWKKALNAMQELLDPANWGWKRNTTGWQAGTTMDHNFRSIPSML